MIFDHVALFQTGDRVAVPDRGVEDAAVGEIREDVGKGVEEFRGGRVVLREIFIVAGEEVHGGGGEAGDNLVGVEALGEALSVGCGRDFEHFVVRAGDVNIAVQGFDRVDLGGRQGGRGDIGT